MTHLDDPGTGDLKILRVRPDRPGWSLVLAHPTEDNPDRFWIHYIQRPEQGRPSGGASGTWTADQLTDPSSLEEILAAQRYLAAKQVLDCAEALVQAKAVAEAFEVVAPLLTKVERRI